MINTYNIGDGRKRKHIVVGRVLVRGTALNVQSWFKVFDNLDDVLDFILDVELNEGFEVTDITDWDSYKWLKRSRFRDFLVRPHEAKIQVRGRLISNASGVDVWYETVRWRMGHEDKGWSFINGNVVHSILVPFWRYNVFKLNFKTKWEEWGSLWVSLRFKEKKFNELMNKWVKEGKVKMEVVE